MGARGPGKKPTALKKAQGQRIRTEFQDEVMPAIIQPEERKLKLSDQAKEIFDDVSPRLIRYGLLTEIDPQAFSRYCVLFDKWILLGEILDKQGMMLEYYDENGNKQTKPNPALTSYLSIHDRLLKLEQQFGMTPSARASIGAVKKPADEKSPEEKLNSALYGDE